MMGRAITNKIIEHNKTTGSRVSEGKGQEQIFFRQCLRLSGLLIMIIAFFMPSFAQERSVPFHAGEQLNFNIYFKYGIVMAKAGTAEYKISNSNYSGKPAIKTELTFKTVPAFDRIYKVRDTLWTYISQDLRPLYHEKGLHEGKTSYREEMFYMNHSEQFSKVRSIRRTRETIKFDTLLFSNHIGYDMLSFFIYARILDFQNLSVGETESLVCFVGRDVVKMRMRNAGQTILEKNELEKIKTIRFEIDVIDKAFEDNKNALEIWITDDKNRIPVKIKAKLKIGAMEAELSSVKNLKHSFDARIVIKPR